MTDKLNIGLIISMVTGSMLLGMLGKPAEMGLFVAAGGIGLSFANIDKIQRFKGAGFEAEMRKAVEEAYATTESLKAIAKPLILSNLINLIYKGRWDGMKEERKHKIKNEMDRLAKLIGVFDEEVRRESEKFFAWHAMDYVHDLETEVNKVRNLQDEEREALRKMVDRDADKYPAVDELKKFVQSLDDDQKLAAQPFLEDYEYFLANSAVRRPEVDAE
jgi:hypothetical protein